MQIGQNEAQYVWKEDSFTKKKKACEQRRKEILWEHKIFTYKNGSVYELNLYTNNTIIKKILCIKAKTLNLEYCGYVKNFIVNDK